MAAKLDIVNRCLALKGQNLVNVEEDGSQEWTVCSLAYDHAVQHLLEEHDWGFAEDYVTLSRTGDSPVVDFEDAYARPTGTLHLEWVRVDDTKTTWKVAGSSILVTDGDNGTVTALVIREPGPEDWPPMFITAVQEMVFAAIESGLKKDQRTADGHLQKAEIALQKARTRTDQEEPKRALFKPSLRTARTTRRA